MSTQEPPRAMLSILETPVVPSYPSASLNLPQGNLPFLFDGRKTSPGCRLSVAWAVSSTLCRGVVADHKGTHKCASFQLIVLSLQCPQSLPWASLVAQLVKKKSACNAADPGSIPGSGRFPGEEHGNPLQYSCLENPMDRGAWRATAHGVRKSQPPPHK